MEKRLIATLATVTLLCSLTGCGNRPSKLSDLYGGSSTNTPTQTTSQNTSSSLPANLTEEIKSVLLYMDQLLEDLPEEKIVEFARSEQFATYKKLFSDLGLS